MNCRPLPTDLVALLAGSAARAGSVTTVTFDTDTSGNPIAAPELFINATALTELYAPWGVHFSGPGGNDGGAILEVGGGSLGPAYSHPNFLAFNEQATLGDGGTPQGPETITFDTLVTEASIYAGASFSSNAFKLEAYDAGDTLVVTDTADHVSGFQWAKLQASWSPGIKRVVLTETTADHTYLYDDLSFTTIPEPSTAALFGLGLGAIALRVPPGLM